jgi:peptide/nickel transport system ATP-binding protein
MTPDKTPRERALLAEHADGRLGVIYLSELVELGKAEDILENP